MAILLADSTPAPEPSTLVDKLLAAKAGRIVGLLCVVLVVWMTTTLWSSQREIAKHQGEIKTAIAEHAAESENELKLSRQLLFAICLNTAQTDEGKRLCEFGR